MPPADGLRGTREKIWYVAVAALCVIAFGAMSAIAMSGFFAGKWYLADVGNIQYCLTNTWNGRFMWSPLMFGNHFAWHFTPFLLLLLPIVWLSPYPIPLVISYQLALALTPWPIYTIARRHGLPPVVSVAAGLWFLANVFTGSLEMAMHFEVFYVLLALGTMALLPSSRRHAWWICAVAALSVKEDAAAWLLAFGAWTAVFEKHPAVRRRGMILAAVSLGWGAVAAAIMYAVARTQTGNATDYINRMGGLSIAGDNLWVFFLLLASSGGFCLLNWRAALLLLVPVPILLGNFPFTRHLLYYYSYPFLPFLAFATISGAATVWNWLGGERRRAWAVAAVLALIAIVQLPMPTRTDGFRRTLFPVTSRDEMRRHVARDILPRDVPVALQFDLWGVTPWRRDVVFLKQAELKPRHYVFLDLKGVHGLDPEEYRKVMVQIRDQKNDGRRKVLFDAYDFIILSPEQPPAAGAASSE